MLRDYWIVNFRTKQYCPLNTEGSFFDGDWRVKTPWPDEDYVNLYAQSVNTDEIFEIDMFYGYDLCRDGMLVGVYFDSDKYTLGTAKQYVSRLKREQDVCSVLYHALKRVEVRSTHP